MTAKSKSKNIGKGKGHSFIQEIADWQAPARVVCTSCGSVWEGEEMIGTANGLEAYIMQGYDPKPCPACVAAGRTVGFSGEFDFDGDDNGS